MNEPRPDIDPRVDVLPREGKVEYLHWCETYHELTATYLAGVEELKEIKALDPAHAALYDWKIDSLLQEAAATMDKWEGHRRRILDKWLGGEATVADDAVVEN